jgi:hypothetical protein
MPLVNFSLSFLSCWVGGEMLDELLPLLEPPRGELHLHAAVVEVSDSTQLVELAANPKIRRYLLARLSDTVALVDPAHVEALCKALLAEGHTPKITEGQIG